MKLPRLVLGDAPFVGARLAPDAAIRADLARFASPRAIIEVLDAALELGVHGLVGSTHERMLPVYEHLRAARTRYEALALYPCIPHIDKYATAIAEHGPLEALRKVSAGSLVGTLFRGALGALTQEVDELMKLLVDAELKPFEGLSPELVLLDASITDLVLGLGLDELFGGLAAHLRAHHRAELGFMTMNPSALSGALTRARFPRPIVAASLNARGYRVGGGREAAERALDGGARVLAMNVLGGGVIPPAEGLGYAARLRGVESILIGASSRAELAECAAIVARVDGAARA